MRLELEDSSNLLHGGMSVNTTVPTDHSPRGYEAQPGDILASTWHMHEIVDIVLSKEERLKLLSFLLTLDPNG